MRSVGVIPARYSSTRFPGKPLALINNKPMIQWVYERSSQAKTLDNVIIATDDQRIVDAVKSFGGKVRMTSPEHQSGTDRIAEVAKDIEADLIVNIQGDEPLIEPSVIDDAVRPLMDNPSLEMGTLACKLPGDIDPADSNVVKVIFDDSGRALYFSRSPIPFYRDADTSDHLYWQHVGLYVYRKEMLLKFTSWAPTSLEQAESLEQLRALEHGIVIHVETTEFHSTAVDTEEDLRTILQTLEAASEAL